MSYTVWGANIFEQNETVVYRGSYKTYTYGEGRKRETVDDDRDRRLQRETTETIGNDGRLPSKCPPPETISRPCYADWWMSDFYFVIPHDGSMAWSNGTCGAKPNGYKKRIYHVRYCRTSSRRESQVYMHSLRVRKRARSRV